MTGKNLNCIVSVYQIHKNHVEIICKLYHYIPSSSHASMYQVKAVLFYCSYTGYTGCSELLTITCVLLHGWPPTDANWSLLWDKVETCPPVHSYNQIWWRLHLIQITGRWTQMDILGLLSIEQSLVGWQGTVSVNVMPTARWLLMVIIDGRGWSLVVNNFDHMWPLRINWESDIR